MHSNTKQLTEVQRASVLLPYTSVADTATLVSKILIVHSKHRETASAKRNGGNKETLINTARTLKEFA